jgi:DNA-binding response OmpR family regulator
VAVAESTLAGWTGDADVPVVVCIAPDPIRRLRLARLLEGEAIVVMAPDTRSARSFLAAVPDSDPSTVDVGDLRLDLLRQETWWRGTRISLTRREWLFLVCLAADPGRAWPFERLYSEVWDGPYLGDPSALTSVVKRLRRKLREADARVEVTSVRGVGYRLSPD